MNEYELTDSIPIPIPGKYPFGRMAVGQSFFAAGTDRRARVAAVTFGRRRGLKFAWRAVTENDVRGFRIWRIA
jgi:hypothetical protein